MRTWKQHGKRLLVMGIVAGLGLAVSIALMFSTYAIEDSLGWLVLGVILAFGYVGTAVVSTTLFPWFRDIPSRAASPVLYVASTMVTYGVGWLWIVG